MSKRKTVVILALLVAVVPKMGFPQGWEDAFYIFAGLLIALLAYLPDRVYCDECRKIISPNGHADKIAGELAAISEKKEVAKESVRKGEKEMSEQSDNTPVA